MKRSMIIAGHKTSVSLEDSFWDSLRQIAAKKEMRPSELVAAIDGRRHGNLSSAIRLFVLAYYQELADTNIAKLSVDAGTSAPLLITAMTPLERHT